MEISELNWAPSYHAIFFAANILLQGAALVFLLTIRNRPPYVLLLGGYFFFALINSVGWFLLHALLQPALAGLLVLLRTMYVFAPYFFVRFCYAFPECLHVREARLFSVFGGCASLLICILVVRDVLNSPPSFLSTLESFSYAFGVGLYAFSFVITLFYSWSLIVLLRKARIMHGDDRRVLRLYTIVSVLLLSVMIAYAMTVTGRMSYDLFSALLSTGFGIVAFLDIFLLLDRLPNHVSFTVRMTGLTYALVVTLISLSSRVVFIQSDEGSQTVRSLLESEYAHVVRGLGSEYFSFMREQAGSGNVTVVYRSAPNVSIPSVGLPEHAVTTACANAEDEHTCYRILTVRTEDRILQGGESLIDYRRRAVTPVVTGLMGVMALGGVFVLVLSPYLYSYMLIRPLRRLVDGFREYQSGRRDVHVSVSFSDEIGYITSVFNKMVVSMEEARQKREQYQLALREREAELHDLQLSRMRSELLLLKKTISPHFLMNTLNTTIGLMREDRESATALVLTLAGQIRAILDVSDRDRISMEQELGLCRRHLALMSIRLERELILETHDVDERRHIPPLIFLTLIENAITHSDLNRSRIAYELHEERAGGSVTYRFVSPFPDRHGPLDRRGLGTRYIVGRLESAFPGSWTYRSDVMIGEAGGSFVAEINIVDERSGDDLS